MKYFVKTLIFISFTVLLTCNHISIYHEDDVVAMGTINNPAIDEASGLAASKLNQGLLWTHNDSGDRNRIFAISSSGEQIATFYLKNAINRDWEDIAIGPGPERGIDYLYVGDIGDNKARYSKKYIYRVKEPRINRRSSPFDSTLNHVERIVFRLPDGERDCEALFVDPETADIYITSKRESQIHLYRLPFPQPVDSTVTAEFIGELPVTQITAGDISRDGLKILLKNYDNVYLWTRLKGQTIADAFKNKPRQLPYHREPQGEAVTWKPDGSGYYTTSEINNDIPAVIYFYPFNQ